MTLTLPGLPEETSERLSTACTVVGLRDLLKAKSAPSEGPKAELSRKLAEFRDGLVFTLVEPSRDPAYVELMRTYFWRDLVTSCARKESLSRVPRTNWSCICSNTRTEKLLSSAAEGRGVHSTHERGLGSSSGTTGLREMLVNLIRQKNSANVPTVDGGLRRSCEQRR